MSGRRLSVLVLSWNYPTAAAPQRGLWVERMCVAAAEEIDVRVIVPTPWVPPLIPLSSIARFRQVPVRERRHGVELHMPRVPGSIEYFTHGLDARLARERILSVARRLHAERPFDLIHAHFIYPDGVVASEIGRALGIPVVTSEHAFWTPWLKDRASVGQQVMDALPYISLVMPVSEFLRASIDEFMKGRPVHAETTVLPNVVDDVVFRPGPESREPNTLLYVGLIRKFKRVDVLLRGVALARVTLPSLRLRILSANAFRAYGQDRREMTELISSLDLREAVTVVNGADPPAVAEAMRRCTLVAVSSTRRETFCSVAAEALACGTPLVITRCGGPEEFVTSDDGVMVEADSPQAFADGIIEAMRRRESFRADDIRARIVGRFGRAAWRTRALELYEQVASSAEGVSHAR